MICPVLKYTIYNTLFIYYNSSIYQQKIGRQF
ncbi:hypothetical protein M086_3797, partial [Bacteroides fragilis str. S13 L11]